MVREKLEGLTDRHVLPITRPPVNSADSKREVDLGTLKEYFLAGGGPSTPPAWDDITGKPSTFAPAAHAASHAPGGSDALTQYEIPAGVVPCLNAGRLAGAMEVVLSGAGDPDANGRYTFDGGAQVFRNDAGRTIYYDSGVWYTGALGGDYSSVDLISWGAEGEPVLPAPTGQVIPFPVGQIVRVIDLGSWVVQYTGGAYADEASWTGLSHSFFMALDRQSLVPDTFTRIELDSVEHGEGFSSGAWVVPKAGVYLITGKTLVESPAGDDDFTMLCLFKNGFRSEDFQLFKASAGTAYYTLTGTVARTLEAGDSLELFAYKQAGSTADTLCGTLGYTYSRLQALKIG